MWKSLAQNRFLVACNKRRFLSACVFSAVIVAMTIPKSERIGDRLQYALPLAGMVCAFDIKDGASYISRYALGLASVHGFKNALPDSGINLRPNGGGNGFPSGHTFSATYGASFMARQCAEKIPYIGPIVALAAGYTATSRVDAEKHNPFQVLFGAIFGLCFDRAFQSTQSRERRKTRLKKVLQYIKIKKN